MDNKNRMSDEESGLAQKYSQLQELYNQALEEKNAITHSRTWRLAALLTSFLTKVGVISALRFFRAVRQKGVKEAFKQAHITRNIVGRICNTRQENHLWDYTARESFNELIRTIAEKEFIGIAICVAGDNKIMLENQHKRMQQLTTSGYLCVEFSYEKSAVCYEWIQDVLYVYRLEYLQTWLTGQCVIAIVCNLKDTQFFDKIGDKLIWIDASINPDMLSVYNHIKADIVIYDDTQKPIFSKDDPKFVCLRNERFAQDILSVEAVLFDKLENLRALSNSASYGCVNVLTATFFNYEGTNYFSGGAERYLVDLNEVCMNTNLRMRVYQFAKFPWIRFYGQVEVIGLAIPTISPESHSRELFAAVQEKYEQVAGNTAAVTIFSPFYLISNNLSTPTIGISHGISWDGENNSHDAVSHWNQTHHILRAADLCNKIISVDTNTPNWLQTIRYESAQKMQYIPNYVDTNVFYPRKGYDDPPTSTKVIITFPRRLYAPRGLYLVLDILDDLLTNYPMVEVHFVGKGFAEDTVHIDRKAKQYGDQVKRYYCTPDKMHEVYRASDISLIPTLYSEGTSLSCLEALASGNAVIATRIGGLPDLIIDNYNGLLIEPNTEALLKAIQQLLDSPDKMIGLKRKGVETARAFSKTRWDTRWTEEIISAIDATAIYQQRKTIQTCIVFCKTETNIVRTVAMHLLKNDWMVFIAMDDLSKSFIGHQRLQIISTKEERYFEPSLILSEDDNTLYAYFQTLC